MMIRRAIEKDIPKMGDLLRQVCLVHHNGRPDIFKVGRKYSEEEKKLVSYHETGHAILGVKLDNAETVQKVTIVPRGQAGGYAMMTPDKESFLQTRTQLIDTITGLLGGRVSEELFIGDISTGAHNDFQKATAIARAMVTEYGMSKLGPVQYEKQKITLHLARHFYSLLYRGQYFLCASRNFSRGQRMGIF